MKKLLILFVAALSIAAAAFAKDRKVAVQSYTCYSYNLADMCDLFEAAGVENVELCLGQLIGDDYPKTRFDENIMEKDPKAVEYAKKMFKDHGGQMPICPCGTHLALDCTEDPIEDDEN